MASTVWKGQLSFGLVSLPVRLVRAARRERFRMHYVTPQRSQAGTAGSYLDAEVDDAPAVSSPRPFAVEKEPLPVEQAGPVERVRQQVFSQTEDAPLTRRDLLKGHEVTPNQFVTFTQQQLRALRPETSDAMEIIRTVRLAEIDPVYFETSYYVIPDRGGERAYGLLFRALKDSDYVAVAELAMHGREHVMTVRPGSKGLIAHTMFYATEIRASDETEADLSSLNLKELQLAAKFVEAIAGPFAPEEFRDSARDRLQALITDKQARAEASAGNSQTQTTPQPVDIMEALRKSLQGKAVTPVKRGPGKATAAPARLQKRKA